MRAAWRRSRILVLLTALVTTIALIMPFGQTARAADVGQWVTTANGQIRISSLSPAKETYSVGDVITVRFRMESVAEAPRRNVVATSSTLTNPSSCSWTAFPAGTAGKYDCSRTPVGTYPPLTYTVTEADADAGQATFALTFTETPSDASGNPVAGDVVVTTLDHTIAVETGAAGPRPEGEYVALASAGDYGYACHRIPALTVAPNGDLLASWDGRPGGCGDAPQANSIIQRRSTDGGQTWGDVTTIAAGQTAAPKFGYSDPSYVVDEETGAIFNFFVKSFDQGFGGSQPGTDPDARNVVHAAVTKSTDNGVTWSEPRVITDDITNAATWNSRFAASGEGIQLKYAPYDGRLVQQFTIRNSAAAGNGYQAVSVYSDDHGDTWQAGTPVGDGGMDENKVVELSDGRLMLNSRPSSGPTQRKVAISTDGGETYGEVTSDPTLIDPRNNASIIRAYPDAPKNSAKAKILLFSNAAATSGRTTGTVRVSYDDGQTWSGSKVFEPGAMAYSTLTALDEEGTYGLLFEGANNQIRYMTISMDWLGVAPVSITAERQTVNRGENTVSFTATNVGSDPVTFTPVISGPLGWSFGAVASVTLAAGATDTFTVDVTVPETADPGTASITATLSIGEMSAAGTAAVTMELLPGQNPTEVIDVTVVNSPPAQPGEEIAQAFDKDLATLWHTPYSGTTFPVDVDMQLGDAPVDVTKLEYVPRPSGSNGNINGYEIWAGDTIETLTKVAEGNFANTNATKTVLLDGTHQVLKLRALSSYGDTPNTWVSAGEIRVRVAVPDSEVPSLPLELVGTLEAQEGFPASNMFDDDPATWFHSPWNATQTFPYNIDLSLGDDEVALNRFVFTPKSGGTTGGENNGRPLTWRILVGDSVDDLTEAAEGSWADNAEPKTVPLEGIQGTIVRLQILTTAGDTGQNNKFVAVAELEVFGEVVPPAPNYLTVSLERTDDLGSPVEVGDELTFTITYTNISDRTIVAFPTASNLESVLTTATRNCRWDGLADGATQRCAFPTHTVTAADLEEGTFTPSVTFNATADRDGTEILEAGIIATLPAITVGAEPEPTPTTTATATATSSPTVTATASTATATSTATVTATSTATATATTTATSTQTATVTSTATATQTATATTTVTAVPTTGTPTVKPTGKPTVKPTQKPVNVYTDPGYHEVNGRQWFTRCEPYSATTRCFTQIWASQVKTVNGKQQWVTDWQFNNLTYRPMDRETWKGNKLAYTNEWTARDGRKWKTECDTAVTGNNGCRSYIWSTVYEATSPGARTFHQVSKWVFNNIVLFN